MNDKPKSLIERKLQDPEYRKRFEEEYAAFKLEAQILYALEAKGWTYSDLAKATHTSKSNVSRDLKAGGILSASFSRISRIAEALGMKLVALLIPKESEHFILPKIEELVRLSTSAAFGDVKFDVLPSVPLDSRSDYIVLTGDKNRFSNFRADGFETASISAAA